MLKKILEVNFFILFICTVSFADVFKEITIKGNQRLSKESIIMFGDIDLKIDYAPNDLNLIIKKLYKTNFFKDVKLDIDNNTLLITVLENPIIEDLEINGIKNKKLTEALRKSMQLKSRKSYVETFFLQDLNLIKNMIKASGYYFAEINNSIIKNDDQNSIRLIYDINLGEKAKINEIVFLGDKKIKDRKLKSIITSEEAQFWKFISNKIYLDSERINLDKRLLKNYYKNNGYYNTKIENSFVEFKNDRSFKLIFNINAGKKFTFNKLNLIVPDDFDPKYFVPIQKLLSELPNEIYSLDRINKILNEIDKVALSKQYEFVDASLNEKIIDDNKINITITLSESEKFYVEKINILGNSFTLEEVIRNTFIVDEGDPFNKILFNKTINNIKAKNIFKTVNSKIIDGSNENLKIIDLMVEEKPTGEISLGAGVGTSGAKIGGGIKENNFLGKGIRLDTNLTFSENSVKGQFTYIKPNFNYTDNTLFTSVKSTSRNRLKDFGYKTSDLGFSLGTSFEQYENLFFKPEIATSFETLETTSTASNSLKKQTGDYLDVYFNYSLNYDLRNKRYQPSEGYNVTFIQELPLASDTYDFKNTIQTSKYKEFPADIIGKISFYGQTVHTLSDKDVRISKRLYIPEQKLRGFESGKVGPVDNSDFVGGNYVTTINMTATLPQLFPSLQNTDFSLFLDTANIWGVDYDSNVDQSNKIRSAVGISLDLMTPIGPLNFSLAQPITQAASDKTESFRFNLGTTF